MSSCDRRRAHRARSARRSRSANFRAMRRSKRIGADWSLKVGTAGKLKKRRFGQTIGEDLNDDEDASIVDSRIQIPRKPARRLLLGRVQARWRCQSSDRRACRIYEDDSRTSGRTCTESDEESASSTEFHLNPSAHLQVPFGNRPAVPGQYRANRSPAQRRPGRAIPVDSTTRKTMISPLAIPTQVRDVLGASMSASSSAFAAASWASTSSIGRLAT